MKLDQEYVLVANKIRERNTKAMTKLEKQGASPKKTIMTNLITHPILDDSPDLDNRKSPQFLADQHFIKHILSPYLTEIYYSMVKCTNKDYLTLDKTKEYMNLPLLIGERIIT